MHIISCQLVASKLNFAPLSFGKALLTPIQVQFNTFTNLTNNGKLTMGAEAFGQLLLVTLGCGGNWVAHGVNPRHAAVICPPPLPHSFPFIPSSSPSSSFLPPSILIASYLGTLSNWLATPPTYPRPNPLGPLPRVPTAGGAAGEQHYFIILFLF